LPSAKMLPHFLLAWGAKLRNLPGNCYTFVGRKETVQNGCPQDKMPFAP